MGKVIFSIMMTIDGFMEGPDQNLDWAIIDEELHSFVNKEVQAFDAFLLGRRTYQIMQEFWPTADADPSAPPYVVEFAQIWKTIPKIVFSRTISSVSGNARLLRDVIPGEITKLKEKSNHALGLGGANLASTFMQHGLIDEYQLYIHPVVLGKGTPVFPVSREKVDLSLVETRIFGSGVVFLRYQSVPGDRV